MVRHTSTSLPDQLNRRDRVTGIGHVRGQVHGAGSDVCFFFFSSRRRHTRLQGDWSSDVCSSDLAAEMMHAVRELKIPFMAGSSVPLAERRPPLEIPDGAAIEEAVSIHSGPPEVYEDRESVVEGKRVDLGGGRIIKKKKKKNRGHRSPSRRQGLVSTSTSQGRIGGSSLDALR